jgi:hypothetical protein
LDREIDEIAGAVREIKQELPIQICCSLGLMNEGQARRLKAAGVDRVNHNLNTSESFHSSSAPRTPSRIVSPRYETHGQPASKYARAALWEWESTMTISSISLWRCAT